jgi:hypothetical protein
MAIVSALRQPIEAMANLSYLGTEFAKAAFRSVRTDA